MFKIHHTDVEPVYDGHGGGTPYGPFSVTIRQDYDPANPWEDWDCMTPLAYSSGRHGGVTVHDSGDSILDFFAHVSPSWVSRHWRKIAEILDFDERAATQQAREMQADYGGGLAESRLEVFREAAALENRLHSVSDYFATLAALYELAGLPVHHGTVNGYSQGDWADFLLVCTREHAARCGFKIEKPGHDIAKSLEGDAELLRSWMFGDVWGYVIERDGAHVDSCYGFYGAWWDDESGVLEAAGIALESAARDAYGVAVNVEFAARGDFRDLRAEWKAARGLAGALAGGPICKALETQARDMVDRWKAARAERLALSEILAS